MDGKAKKRAVLIAGPTASGKSALALRRAIESGGVVVNTDAMQVYSVLGVLTARPAPGDLVRAPHHLYGTVLPSVRFSTGDWYRAIEKLIQAPEVQDQTLIFVGGTGLYWEALINGVAEVPEVPAEVTAAVQVEIQELDSEARARLMAERDPEMARRLRAPDPQRVVRALSVLAATGRSLASYQDEAHSGLLEDFELERIVLNPDRDVLRERIGQRFAGMFTNGAVEEVEALLALDLDPTLPAMKAIGVPEIRAWLEGKITKEQAIQSATIATWQYAKRQRTWFRSRMADWTWVDPLVGRGT